MHSRLVCLADVSHPLVGMRHQPVNQRRLSHATIATQQGNLPFQLFSQCLHTIPVKGRDGTAFIAYRLIEVYHHLLIMQFLLTEQVRLVED